LEFLKFGILVFIRSLIPLFLPIFCVRRGGHKRIFPPIGARAVVFKRNIINKKKETAQKNKLCDLAPDNYRDCAIKKTLKPPTLRLFQNKAKKKRNLRALAPSWQNSLKPPKTGKTQQKQPKIKKTSPCKNHPTSYL